MSKQPSTRASATKRASARHLSGNESSAAGQAASVGVTPPQRFAHNEDQVPPTSLDDPWGNLHPARIWPD